MKDDYNLQRFVDAQEGVVEGARAELRRGRKTGHWMWFIFPQLRGLGSSSMAEYYGITSLAEARAYLEDPLLGERLMECSRIVTLIEGQSLREIFGSPDDMKFKSSMTLFARAAEENSIFIEAINKFCDGSFDPPTLKAVSAMV
jgi:uncharacterized protein (DUF1810 family)